VCQSPSLSFHRSLGKCQIATLVCALCAFKFLNVILSVGLEIAELACLNQQEALVRHSIAPLLRSEIPEQRKCHECEANKEEQRKNRKKMNLEDPLKLKD
jgi:rubredoxin